MGGFGQFCANGRVCIGKEQRVLTAKQKELLLFIHSRLQEGAVSPSFEEMKDALGLKSKSGIHRLISGLEERGFIQRLPHRARALEVLRLPDALSGDPSVAPVPATPPAPRVAKPFRPNVIRGGFGDTSPVRTVGEGGGGDDGSAISLPLYGRIAAGTPIEALRDSTSFADVPSTFLGQGDHYALEVDGDSMVEAGILDGDTVIIRRCDSAENGTIVVALVDEVEVTLKRLRRRHDSVALEPANSAYQTRVLPAHRVQVQGRLVGLMRQY